MPHTNKRRRALEYQEDTGYVSLRKDPIKNGDALDPVRSTSLKNQIRSVKRLLHKQELSEDRNAALRERVQVLEKLKEARESKSRERHFALKYHKVKFFERCKAERRLAKLRKLIKQNSNDDPPSEELLLKLKTSEEDLLYVTYFPKSEKYISLYGKRSGDADTAYTEETRKRQLYCRQQALKAAADATDIGEILPTDIIALKSGGGGATAALRLRSIPQYPLEADDDSHSLCASNDNETIDGGRQTECQIDNGNNYTTTTTQERQQMEETNSGEDSSNDEEDESSSKGNTVDVTTTTTECIVEEEEEEEERDSKSNDKEYSSDESSNIHQTHNIDVKLSSHKGGGGGKDNNITRYDEPESAIRSTKWENSSVNEMKERLKDRDSDGGAAPRNTSSNNIPITQPNQNQRDAPTFRSHVERDDFFMEEDYGGSGMDVDKIVENKSKRNKHPKRSGKKLQRDSTGKYRHGMVDRYQRRRTFHSKFPHGHSDSASGWSEDRGSSNQKWKKWQSRNKS